MANEKHLEILKQGIEAWNKWRRKYYYEKPDLREADLREADLSGANLSRANLSDANLNEAELREANLRESNITGAIFFLTFRDFWKIDGIKCDYVYWDSERRERTPKDRDFRPGEFEKIYTLR